MVGIVPKSEKVNNKPDHNSIPPVSGSDIRRQRELKKISLDEIKEKTKIGKFTLKLIEDDMYSSLPATVYLRSFVKQIAAIIGMDPKKTAEGYLKRMESFKKKKITQDK